MTDHTNTPADTTDLHNQLTAAINELEAGHPIRNIWGMLDSLLTAGAQPPAPWDDYPDDDYTVINNGCDGHPGLGFVTDYCDGTCNPKENR